MCFVFGGKFATAPRWLIQIIFSFVFSCHLQARILDDKNEVKNEVISIFKHFTPLYSHDQRELLLNPTLDNLNAIAQSIFLRALGKERKDIVGSPIFKPYDCDELYELFKALGDIGDVVPPRPSYRYIILSGATVPNMRLRLLTLIEAYKNRYILITPETELILLAGERPLFETETAQVLLDPSPLPINPNWQVPGTLPTNEAAALLWIMHQSELPDELRDVKTTYVCTPRTRSQDSAENTPWRSPTAYDTVKNWIDLYHPTPGSCLCISTQPFVYYQQLTIKSYLDKIDSHHFQVDGMGKEWSTRSSFGDKLPVYLDNLARTLYTELQVQRSRR